MRKRYRNWNMSALAILAAAAAPVVRAQTSDWTGASTNGPNNLWTDATNWDNGVPISGNVASFGDIGSGNTIVDLGGTAQPINSIAFVGSSTGYTLGIAASSDAFTFDSLGSITVNNTVTVGQTINAAINTTGNLSISNSVVNGLGSGSGVAGLTLGAINITGGGNVAITHAGTNSTTVLNGVISDVGGIPGSVSYVATTAGGNNNNFIINGINTYSGTTSISIGGNIMQIATDSPFGTAKVLYSSQAQFQAIGGTRTMSNAVDMNGGFNVSGTNGNGFNFNGPWNVVNTGASRTFGNQAAGATVTFGDPKAPSTFTLGNPASNGGDGVGKTIGFSMVASNSAFVMNDVLQNPSSTGVGAVTFTYSNSNGTVTVNSLNTYTGNTNFGGTGTGSVVIFNHSYTSGATSGPFGVGGAMVFSNSNGVSLRPVSGNQTLANPITVTQGFSVSNATGDNSGLTLTGNITLGNSGRTISNNFTGSSGAVLTLGAGTGTSAATIALPTGANNQTLVFNGAGMTIINDNFVQQGTSKQNIQFNAGSAGTIIVNGNLPTGGNLTLSGVTSTNGVGQNVLNTPFGGTGLVNIGGNDIHVLNAQSTYSGLTTITGANNGAIIKIPVSSVMNGTSVVSGAFGVGTIQFNSSGIPRVRATGGDRTVGNPIQLLQPLVMDNDPGDTSSLTFLGNINLGSNTTFIANGFTAVASAGMLTLGSATTPATITLTATNSTAGQTTSFQAYNGPIVVNDAIVNGSKLGNVAVNNSTNVADTGTVTFTGNNTYTGITTIGGGTLSISSDANLGSGGAVNIGPGTLLSTGTFTTARTVNLTDLTAKLDATGGNTLSLTGPLTDVGAINKGTNLGTVQMAQPTGYTATANVNVNGGTLSVGNAGVATGPLVVPGTLNVADTAKIALLPSTTGVGTNSGVVHSINNLNLNTTGILDLGNTAMTAGAATPTSTVRQYLINGYSNGNWNGTSGGGITSTWAANDASKRTAVGYNAQPDGSTLVAATLYGDTNLKGSVGLSDYNTLAANFNKPGEWAQGDFDYNGTVGLSDYNLLAANFNKSAQPGGGVAAAGAGGAGGAGGAAKPAAATLTGGSADPAGQTTKPNGVVDPGAGNVLLEADPTTGKVYIVGHDSNINSYEVDSAAGKLTFVSGKNPGGYNTLTAQSTTDFIPGSNNPSEGTWAVLSSQSGTFVAEVYPASASPAFDIIGPGLQVFDLNKSGLSAWTAGTPISDLTFKYGNGTGATLTPAVVDLSAGGVPEPTCLALAGIAAGGLLSRRRRCVAR